MPDDRTGQVAPRPNVEVYFESARSAEEMLALSSRHVAIATGSERRRDSMARLHLIP